MLRLEGALAIECHHVLSMRDNLAEELGVLMDQSGVEDDYQWVSIVRWDDNLPTELDCKGLDNPMLDVEGAGRITDGLAATYGCAPPPVERSHVRHEREGTLMMMAYHPTGNHILLMHETARLAEVLHEFAHYYMFQAFAFRASAIGHYRLFRDHGPNFRSHIC